MVDAFMSEYLGASGLDVLLQVVMVLIALVWKLAIDAIALFKTIERRQIRWFTVLFISLFLLPFDFGIVAIIYLILYKSGTELTRSKYQISYSKGKRIRKR